MNTNITFLNIVAEYCNTPADEITNDMRFIEDLGFSSLDFMTFLGDLEDTFDVEIDEDEIINIHTIQALLHRFNIKNLGRRSMSHFASHKRNGDIIYGRKYSGNC